MSRNPSEIDKIADSYLDWMVEQSPSYATYLGRPGGEDRLDDESPAAHEKSAKKAAEVLKQLDQAVAVDDTDRVTKDAIQRTLKLDIETHESGLWRRNINVIASPAQGIREIFDLSPTATEQDWVNLVGRNNAVAGAVAGYIETLRTGIATKDTPARRQVEQVLEQTKKLAAKDGFFQSFAAGARTSGADGSEATLPAALQADLDRAAQSASDAYGQLAAFLENELLPAATPEDAMHPGGYGGVIHEMLEARDVRMGQLGMSNQVSHHIPYMYDYAGQPSKTAEKVHEAVLNPERLAAHDLRDSAAARRLGLLLAQARQLIAHPRRLLELQLPGVLEHEFFQALDLTRQVFLVQGLILRALQIAALGLLRRLFAVHPVNQVSHLFDHRARGDAMREVVCDLLGTAPFGFAYGLLHRLGHAIGIQNCFTAQVTSGSSNGLNQAAL